jgi:hypothetical protein
MEGWQMFIAVAGVVIGLFGLLGPALIYLGVCLGTLRQSSLGAHKRIDRLEEILNDLPTAIREEMRDVIQQGWKNCPLALQHSKEDK